MEINPEIQRYYTLLNSVGKAALHHLFPNDFEYYFCALELVNSKNKVEDFLIFPIMPDSIVEPRQSSMNYKITAGGTSVLKNDNFIPILIKLQGTFGRRFKFLVGRGAIDASLIQFKTPQNPDAKVFSNQFKTGYGCIKVLEKILEASLTTDKEGNPYKLNFYNLALGTNYLVEFKDCSTTYGYENYPIFLTAVRNFGQYAIA